MERLSDSVVLLLVGTLVVASALLVPVVWPNYGQTPYFLDASPVDETGNESGVIEYDELPPVVQESFDPSGQSEPMYIEGDPALDRLDETQYIRHEGDLYRVSLYHGDGAWIFVTLLRYGLFTVGGLLAVAGIGVGLYKRIRQSTTSES
ncbi:hypothetical protein [Halohasta litorea]|uniref:DUF7979 domain-containing protein n=1 Tax=Halohasta litorea TaxID=869891 RepID=A0ABD6D5H1_9EURY|nr:hypothetical protein [Halohasta litorea]